MTDTHIKMPAVTPRVQYTANGTDTIFQYPFPIFASEDVKIAFNGVDQIAGFMISGAGNSNGGSVTFDTAPASGVIVTISRQVPYERLTDFLEAGEFSAEALNSELDYLTASVQQLERDQGNMLRYADMESTYNPELPSAQNRANKALGFDGNGNPIAVDYGLTQAPSSFTATGTGASPRQVTDKLSDLISIKDFGAVGDGVADDTLAIQAALNSHNAIWIPQGTYRITNTLQITSGKNIKGAGQFAILRADNNLFTVLNIRGENNILDDFIIQFGLEGIRMEGQGAVCVQNRLQNLTIQRADTGIILDGGTDTNRPCYWNIIMNCLVLSPLVTGIDLTLRGAGDTPNANIFDNCRVYSQGQSMSGYGIIVNHGSFYNRFINCEVNVHGTAQGCFTLGPGSNETVVDNLYTESYNGVPNVHLQSGSRNSYIQNLLAQSDGPAIWDQSGGNYQAINAGFPIPNRFDKVQVDDMITTLSRVNTNFIDVPAAVTIDLNMDISVNLVSAFNGEVTINVPLPANYAGSIYTIKKVDFTGNAVRLSEPNGLGIDRKSDIYLGGPYDYVTILSNGAEWFILSSNRMAGNTKYYDTTGTLDIDMAVDTYLISSFGGAVTCRLPPANAAKAIGRTITIKKTDNSTNVVNVSEQGGNGPDQYTQPLNAQYNAITVTSNGGQWYIVSKF